MKSILSCIAIIALVYVFYPLFIYFTASTAPGIKDVLKKDHLIYTGSNYIQIFLIRLFLFLAAAAIIKIYLLHRDKIDIKRTIKNFKLTSDLISGLKEKIIPMSEIQRKNLEKNMEGEKGQ